MQPNAEEATQGAPDAVESDPAVAMGQMHEQSPSASPGGVPRKQTSLDDPTEERAEIQLKKNKMILEHLFAKSRGRPSEEDVDGFKGWIACIEEKRRVNCTNISHRSTEEKILRSSKLFEGWLKERKNGSTRSLLDFQSASESQSEGLTPCKRCVAEQPFVKKVKSNIRIFETLPDPKAQIRLLLLGRTSTPDEITVSIGTYSMEKAPKFNAISYVCGEALLDHAIWINEQPYWTGRNCFDALQQAWQHDSKALVWIDAICINQHDPTEKSAQVAIMGTIYKQAARVLAYIGPPDEASVKVLSASKDLSSFVAEMKKHGLIIQRDEYCHAMAGFCEEFEKFSARSYFSRAWIVQEISTGKDRTFVLCGKNQVSWSKLVNLANFVHDVAETCSYAGGCAYNDISTLNELQSCEFPGYLGTMTGFNCQDPRDRFYSTLGRVDWHSLEQTPPTPNYKTTPIQLAFELLDRTRDMKLDGAWSIARALELRHRPELLVDFETRDLSRDGIRRTWRDKVHSAHVVRQHHDGKLLVELSRAGGQIMYNYSVHASFDQDVYPDDWVDQNGLSKIFTGDRASVLATNRIRANDIIVMTWATLLVLRPCCNQSDFSIVGAAFFAGKYAPVGFGSPPTECGCWGSPDIDRANAETLGLSYEISNEVALASAMMKPDNVDDQPHDREAILLYLKDYALGTILADSGGRFPMTSHPGNEFATPGTIPQLPLQKPCANCEKTENPFWSNLCLSNGAVVSRAWPLRPG